MAVIRRPRDGALLVSESPEPLFQRPLGGHVEFGEYAVDTIHREFGEEIGQVLTDVRLLGVLENIFGWRGGTEHEVVFIFAAAFLDEAAYAIEEQLIRDDTEPKNRVLWRAAERGQPTAVSSRTERADCLFARDSEGTNGHSPAVPDHGREPGPGRC